MLVCYCASVLACSFSSELVSLCFTVLMFYCDSDIVWYYAVEFPDQRAKHLGMQNVSGYYVAVFVC